MFPTRWIRMIATFALGLFALGSASAWAAPVRPEAFVGVYVPIRFVQNGYERLPYELDLLQIEFVLDKVSNTLIAKVAQSLDESQEGARFLLPFVNINQKAIGTEIRGEMSCVSTLVMSRALADAIELRVVSSTRSRCLSPEVTTEIVQTVKVDSPAYEPKKRIAIEVSRNGALRERYEFERDGTP